MIGVKQMPTTKVFSGKKYDLVAEGFSTKTAVEKAAKFYKPMYNTKIVRMQYTGVKKVFYALYAREKAHK